MNRHKFLEFLLDLSYKFFSIKYNYSIEAFSRVESYRISLINWSTLGGK